MGQENDANVTYWAEIYKVFDCIRDKSLVNQAEKQPLTNSNTDKHNRSNSKTKNEADFTNVIDRWVDRKTADWVGSREVLETDDF